MDHASGVDPASRGGDPQPEIDETASRILTAASELLQEGGPGAVSTRAVAARAGVTTMGIVTRFGSKAGVIDALYREGFGRLGQALDGQPVDGDAVDDVLRLARIYRLTANANRSHFRVMFGKPFPEYEPSPESARVAVDAFSRVTAAAERLVEQLGAARPAQEVAFELWAAVHGVTALEHAHVLSASQAERLNVGLLTDLIRGVAATAD